MLWNVASALRTQNLNTIKNSSWKCTIVNCAEAKVSKTHHRGSEIENKNNCTRYSAELWWINPKKNNAVLKMKYKMGSPEVIKN